MPAVIAALPAISGAVGAVGTVASMFKGGQGHVGNTAQGPNDVWPLRQMLMQYLMKGTNPAGSALGQLTVPGFNADGTPNGAMAGVNQLFDATRERALGQAKESAGNLTGSGYNNLFGSALAQSLGQQQAQLGDIGMKGALANQNSILNMFMGLGTQGVGQGQPTYTPGWGSQLAGLGGQLGTLAGMFPNEPRSNVGTGGTSGTGRPFDIPED